MKNIVLFGDSICFGAPEACPPSPGYGIYVKKKLEGRMGVYLPRENCRFAYYTLRYAHEWAKDMPRDDVDVVHWNNGLWDVLRLFGDDPFTDLDSYGVALKRIYKRMRLLFPNAKVIFALSTSVKEEWASRDFFRCNRDIELYNEKAIEVLSEFQVEFNDLYSITRSFDDSMRSDWVHYGDVGSSVLADAVIEKCLEVMK